MKNHCAIVKNLFFFKALHFNLKPDLATSDIAKRNGSQMKGPFAKGLFFFPKSPNTF